MSSKVLELAQHIPNATPQQVYTALTTTDGLAQWWWPHIADTTYSVDARLGGAYDIRSIVAGIGVRGEFTALEPFSRLGFTWNWMNDGISEVEEKVDVVLEVSEDGTILKIAHHLAPEAGDGSDLRQGWSDVLARFATLWS